jgi:hypothetical protein
MTVIPIVDNGVIHQMASILLKLDIVSLKININAIMMMVTFVISQIIRTIVKLIKNF